MPSNARAAVCRCLPFLFIVLACSKNKDGRSSPSSSAPPAAESGGADTCNGRSGEDTEPISGPYLPRSTGGYCLDPRREPKTYGDNGRFSIDEVCTTAFGGECEAYKRFGLDGVLILRYVDATGAPNSVEVSLSRFKTVNGAYATFTHRVVAGGDPAQANFKPLAAGAAGAMSSSKAYVWRGNYLAELTFVTQDTKMTPDATARERERSTGAIAKEIGSKLPGQAVLPFTATVLPAASLVPLGIAYYLRDALGLEGVGPMAVGYYADGEKRWRDLAVVHADIEMAKDTLRVFKAKSESLPLKGVGDEAVRVVLQQAPDRAKAEYFVARKGGLVVGVGDEELVLDRGLPSDTLAARKLTKDEKMAKLAALLGGK